MNEMFLLSEQLTDVWKRFFYVSKSCIVYERKPRLCMLVGPSNRNLGNFVCPCVVYQFS